MSSALRPPTTGPGVESRRSLTGLVALYMAVMPFLAGLPRDTLLPLVRPSEALQLVVTGAAIIAAVVALVEGKRWRARPQRQEWWLLATVALSTVAPLLWLLARDLPVGTPELISVLPFAKYALLFVLVRALVRTRVEAQQVLVAIVTAASLVAMISISQAIGVGPVIETLERFFVSSTDDVVDGGRGTTTIGSSIATGAYLSLAAGLALSVFWTEGRRRWLAPAALCLAGALASGQAGNLIGLAVLLPLLAHHHSRLRSLVRWAVPFGLVGIVGLWTVVAARLDDLDQGSGLPVSWLVRWNNLSELYLPSLLDGGWILGVTPDAIIEPPDIWRTNVYLESGYLWLLWVGGVPLLVAAVGFLVSVWRSAEPPFAGGHPAVQSLARPAVAMIAVVSIIDPHLTLRASADLFFVVIALGLVGRPLLVPLAPAPTRWRNLLGTELGGLGPTLRLQVGEASPNPKPTGPAGSRLETALTLQVVDRGRPVASTVLSLHRRGRDLIGLLEPARAIDEGSRVLLWREVALVSASLRLAELRVDPAERWFAGAATVPARELGRAAALARRLETRRLAEAAMLAVDSDRRTEPVPEAAAAASHDPVGRPAVRIEVTPPAPSTKRLLDLVVGSLALLGTAPIWLLVAALVRRSGPGPILFRQVRIGTGGLPFQILKFRTMRTDNDDSAHRAQNRREILDGAEAGKDAADPRITPIGHLLRRLSLDELPQLVNVLRGEMSLVGPRPSLLWESELYPPTMRRRLVTPPGLTGLWQVSGRADLSMTEMLELDLGYVDRRGLGLDLQCLVRTASSLATREGAR